MYVIGVIHTFAQLYQITAFCNSKVIPFMEIVIHYKRWCFLFTQW